MSIHPLWRVAMGCLLTLLVAGCAGSRAQITPVSAPVTVNPVG